MLARSSGTAGSEGGYHGTDAAGIVFAEGIGMDRGLLHCVERPIVFASRNTGVGTGDLYDHYAELVDPNGPYRAIAQTRSVGKTRTTDYTTWSAEFDQALFDLDFVVLQSQSNEGNQDSRPEAWAKNVTSVGGIRTNSTLDRSDDYWSGASIGPASDNRIKPDLAGQFTGVFTANHDSDTDYNSWSGTSAATPTIAGAFGIMFEMWADGVFNGGPGQSRDVFDSRPHASTARALMIHSAYRYEFSGGDSANLSRVHQGWGMPDLQNLYDTAQKSGWQLPILINENDVLAPNTSNAYNLSFDGSEPLKATLVYRDPAGNPAASIQRINDLTLKVTSPSGTVYWGNNGLRNGNWSTSGGVSNTVDTIENVFIEAPEVGTWSIEVIGDDIVEDGFVETPEMDAVYALVATGGTAVSSINNPPSFDAATADQSNTEGDIVSVIVSASDPDGDTLTYSATGLPASLSIDPATGVISGTIGPDTAGTYNVEVTVSDGALSDVQSFTWTVTSANQAPSFDATIADQSSTEGDAVNLAVSASDPDGDALTYSATGLPAGLSIDPTTGVISGTIGPDTAGTYNVEVTVSDGTLSDVQCFTWTVTPNVNVNQPPVFDSNPANQVGYLTDSVWLTVGASDADGDSLTYTASGLPPGLVIDPATGEISGTLSAAPGDYPVTISVSDGIDSTDVSFIWSIVAPQGGAWLETVVVGNVGDTWTTASLEQSYTDPVAVCSVKYVNNTLPVVVRMQNLAVNSFQIRLQNPSGAASVADDVHCLVVESGQWTLPDGRLIEAQHYTSTVTAAKGSWTAETQSYLNGYSKPVVLGQVMTTNDANWSTFWNQGASRTAPPNSDSLQTGKEVAEDTNVVRVDEEIGFIVIEQGVGTANGLTYEATLGADTVRGLNVAAVDYSFNQSFSEAPEVAIVTMAGMDGNNGAWAMLRGADALTQTTITTVVDEDQISDSERTHTTEQVGYFVFDVSGSMLLAILPLR